MEKSRKRNILIGIYVFTLSVGSACIVIQGASAEPYLQFRPIDAFSQIGAAVALMVLWLQFTGWLLYGVFTCRLPKPWLAVTILVGMALFHLWDSPAGYIGDITRYVVEKH